MVLGWHKVTVMSFLRYGALFGAGACVGGGGAAVLSLLNGVSWKDLDYTKSHNDPTDTAVKTEQVTSSFKYGHPHPSISFHSYSEHSLMYDRSRRIPLWVAETITRWDKNEGNTANRKKSMFKPDPALPPTYSSSNVDFRRSGWSRGHMAPAGNYKHSQQAMDDTFFLTNIVPQDIKNNSGYWNRLEMFCRSLLKQFKEVHIMSGPLFLPEIDQDSGKKYIKYEVIGDSGVAAPTHLFKVILAEKGDGVSSLAAFIIPNKAIGKVDLTEFQVSLDELESFTGCTFHPKLDRRKVVDLCSGDGCKLISLEIMDLVTRLYSAKSVSELYTVWNQSTIIKKDHFSEEIFKKRKFELETDQQKAIQ